MLDSDRGIFIYLHKVINSDSYSMIHNEGYLGEADSQASHILKWKAPKSTDFYSVYRGNYSGNCLIIYTLIHKFVQEVWIKQ